MITEYIRRNDAINAVKEAINISHFNFIKAKAAIEAIPPADVRPVVLCLDCKHSHMTYSGECKYCDFLQEDGGDALYLPKDFFCAAGERKNSDG